ncbi:AmmeMemoRadiSam system protein B [bacterium]|nr:AmmeMemoRadiSam system protein B [bacterium]
MTKILPATHMNSWYPSGKKLDDMLMAAYQKVPVNTDGGHVRAIIVPHAGYQYCVETSMHAFAQINPNEYDRVIVMGPSHRMAIPCCTIADADFAESPYGNIPFDTNAIRGLLTNYPNLFSLLPPDTAAIEHSMEMEFPLLKFIFKSHPFKIIPIMIGSVSAATCAEIAEALAPLLDDRTLFVVSSDFCHWGSRFSYTKLPAVDGEIWQKIEALDRMATEQIATNNPNNFASYLKETKNTICGRNAILVMMNAIKGYHAEFPAYSQSSHCQNMYDSSVSYMAGVFRK